MVELVHFIICPICNKWKDLERECGQCDEATPSKKDSSCTWKYICIEWETHPCKCEDDVIISFLISKLLEENLYETP